MVRNKIVPGEIVVVGIMSKVISFGLMNSLNDFRSETQVYYLLFEMGTESTKIVDENATIPTNRKVELNNFGCANIFVDKTITLSGFEIIKNLLLHLPIQDY